MSPEDDLIHRCIKMAKITHIFRFQRHCEGRLDYLIICGDLKEKRQLGFKQFKKISKVSVSHTYAVKNFRNLFGKRKQM